LELKDTNVIKKIEPHTAIWQLILQLICKFFFFINILPHYATFDIPMRMETVMQKEFGVWAADFVVAL